VGILLVGFLSGDPEGYGAEGSGHGHHSPVSVRSIHR